MVIVNYTIMCIIFGTTFLAIKIGVDTGAPPFFSAGVRFFVAGLIILLWMKSRKQISFSLLLKKEIFLTGMGLTFSVFAASYWAEQYVASGIVAVLSAMAPILIILVQIIVLKERVPSLSKLGCSIAFMGVLVLLWPNITANASIYWFMGCLAVLVSQIFFASATLYSKKVMKVLEGTSSVAINGAQMMHGSFMLLILSFLTEDHQSLLFQNSHAMMALLYLIILGSMIGHSLYYWLVMNTNPLFPSTWLYISPILALFVGAIIYHEQLSWMSIVGGGIIICGVALANFKIIKQLVIKPSLERA
ncbi:EamA family transporter [Terrilactibacillus sp. BCM23-1]|uniref:EamA family transporter n=1 Tax=Terrilactibacillus tamarindi TaxID=2599694 RepID=A0A6N8CPV0_9BACI|nr:EamA family transporter [Terrilactibacillus tamarindi]MTT30935.1 EamA family transporter [Terrilactibacillus tamarindi]